METIDAPGGGFCTLRLAVAVIGLKECLPFIHFLASDSSPFFVLEKTMSFLISGRLFRSLALAFVLTAVPWLSAEAQEYSPLLQDHGPWANGGIRWPGGVIDYRDYVLITPNCYELLDIFGRIASRIEEMQQLTCGMITTLGELESARSTIFLRLRILGIAYPDLSQAPPKIQREIIELRRALTEADQIIDNWASLIDEYLAIIDQGIDILWDCLMAIGQECNVSREVLQQLLQRMISILGHSC